MKPVQKRTVLNSRFRHPFDDAQVRALFSGRSKEYKMRRMSYPHLVLQQKDPHFRQAWTAIRQDFNRGNITEPEYEKRFFNEVANSLNRRRTNL